MRRILSALVLLALASARPIAAAPYIPAADDEVLEVLPTRTDDVARQLARLRSELTRNPNDPARAVDLARRYLEIGRSESDPRYLGWAEGVLEPWWSLESPPLEVLVLRATLRQNRHEFAAALADLDQLLARDPRNAQGWLTRAVVAQVRGNLREARRSCAPLLRFAHPLTATSCLASAASLSGRAAQSYERLERTLAASQDAPVGERVFASSILADMAVRLGRGGEAERHFHAALALAPRDAWLLGAYADWLLDADRPADVVALLRAETRVDGLLLRVVLAEQRLGSDELAPHLGDLRARFAASRQRGDTLHQGEEARFALAIERDPATALRLASANFGVQREPRDARVLLEAALARRNPSAAQPALDLLRETGLEDAALARLAARIEAIR